MFYRPFVRPDADEVHLLKVSRIFVIFWGVVLAVMAWQVAQALWPLATQNTLKK